MSYLNAILTHIYIANMHETSDTRLSNSMIVRNGPNGKISHWFTLI